MSKSRFIIRMRNPRWRSIMVLLIFLGTMVPIGGVAQDQGDGEEEGSVAGTGESLLRITKSDYQQEVDEIHGEDTFAYVVLEDASFSEPDVRSKVRVEVTSETDSSTGMEMDLLETGMDTGVFYGGFGFSTTASQSPNEHPVFGLIGVDGAGDTRNGRIEVSQGASGETVRLITVGGPVEQTAEFEWFEAQDAEVLIRDQFNRTLASTSTIVGYDGELNIVVQDSDLNKDPDRAEQYLDLVRAYSDSQPEGKTLFLSETGRNTGTFQSTLQFSRTPSPESQRLAVEHTDRIQIGYQELETVAGSPRDHLFPDGGEWVFIAAEDGSIESDRDLYFGMTSESTNHGADRAVILIDAPGMTHKGVTNEALADEIDVEVTTEHTQQEMDITATQIGSRGDTYMAVFGFTSGDTAKDEDPPRVKVNPDRGNERITVRFDDVDATGHIRSRSHTFFWSHVEPAQITVGDEQLDLFSGTTQDVQVTLEDTDSNRDPRNRESLIVQVKSTSDPIDGLDVPLLETGPDSGVFTGTFRFTTGSTGSGALRVSDGDQFVVEYRDPYKGPKGEGLVRSPPKYWRMPTDAEIRTDHEDYYVQFDDQGDLTTRAIVYLEDKDQSHPLRRDGLSATAVALDSSDTEPVTLREVGMDSGLFVGLVDLDALGLQKNVRFEIQHREPLPDGSVRFVETPQLRFWKTPQEDDVVVRFEKTVELFDEEWAQPMNRILADSTPESSINDPSSIHLGTVKEEIAVYGEPNSLGLYNETGQELTVKISSTRCPEKRNIVLERDDQVEHRFIGNVSLSTHPATRPESGDPGVGYSFDPCQFHWNHGQIGIDPSGDQLLLEAFREDEITTVEFEGVTFERQNERIRFIDDEMSDLERTSASNRTIGIRLDGGKSHAFNTEFRHIVETRLFSRGIGCDISVPLVETDESSGVFIGHVQFSEVDPESGFECGNEQDFLQEVGRVPVITDRALLPQSDVPQYGIYDAVVAVHTDSEALPVNVGVGDQGAAVLWYPSSDEQLRVHQDDPEELTIELVDGDGVPHRTTQSHVGDDGTQVYGIDQPYIAGSEHVYVHRKETFSSSTPAANPQFKVGSAHDRRPAVENISDRNRDGIVDCKDVTIFHGSISCGQVDPDSGTVTLKGTPVGILEYSYMYRAALAETDNRPNECPPEDPNSDNDPRPFEYERRSDGIRLCAPPESEDPTIEVELDYSKRDRAVVVRSPTELEAVPVSYSRIESEKRNDGALVFAGTVPVESDFDEGNNAIHVQGARTKLEFLYLDPVREIDGLPSNIDQGHFRSNPVSVMWREFETARIDVMDHGFEQVVGDVSYGPGLPVQVMDQDSSRFDRRDTIVVKSQNGTAPMNVTLRETGIETGVFRGIVPVQGNESGPVTLIYRDPRGQEGHPVLRNVEVDWRPSEEADLTVLNATGDEATEPFEGVLSSFGIELKDADANRDTKRVDTVTARIVSSSDPVGEVVDLEETGIDTGVFTATGLRFEAAHNPGSGRIFVQDGDEVRVSYVDRMTDDGFQRIVDSESNGPPVIWRAAQDAEVRFDRAFQVGLEPGTPTDDPSGLQKLARAYPIISDPERNQDPKQIDVLQFDGGDLQNPDGGDDGAAGLLIGLVDPGGGMESALDTIRLIETGHDTGEFMTVVSFTEDASVSEEDLPTDFARIPVQAGRLVRVEYTDPDPLDPGEEGVFSDEAPWYPEGFAVVRFDRPGYGSYDERPRVTVYDADAGSARAEVTVSSQASPSGMELSLNPRPDAETGGIFEGNVSLSPDPASNRLHVDPEDELEARYQDISFARTASHAALFIEGLTDPPVTTLVTDPDVPDGENGWFVTQPEIRFETDRPSDHIDKILFRRDGGQLQEFQDPLMLGEGIHEFEYWAVDVIGNVEEPSRRTIRVSLNHPTETIHGFHAVSRPDGQIELSWDPLERKLNPFIFGEYRIFRGSLNNQVGATTSETFTDRPPEDGEYVYFAYVANRAGRFVPDTAVSTEGVSDRVPPVVQQFDVQPRELHADQGESTVVVNLSVTESTLPDVEDVFLRVEDPFQEVVDEVPMEPAESQGDWHLSYNAFNVSGMYRLHGVAADAVGNEGSMNHTVRYFAEDREPPRVVSIPEEIEHGRALNVTVRDNDRGISMIAYAVGDGSLEEVDVPELEAGEDHCVLGPCEMTFSIGPDELELGDNTIRLILTDANDPPNEAETTHSVFVIAPPSPTEPPEGAPVFAQSSRLVEFGGSMRFSVESESPLIALSATLETGERVDLLQERDPETGVVDYDVGELESGENTVTVQAINSLGTFSEEFTFYILEDGIPLPPEKVVVRFDDRGRPVVGWSPSPTDRSKVGGYLVHRFTGDWSVIAATGKDAVSYVDKNAESNQDYEYTVTAYGVDGEGYVEPGESSNRLPWFRYMEGFSVQTEKIAWIPPGLWIVLATVVGGGLLATAVFTNWHRIFPPNKRRDEYLTASEAAGSGSGEPDSEYREGAEWAEDHRPPASEVFSTESAAWDEGMSAPHQHQLQCPVCNSTFLAEGLKPLVTVCTNCGRKGILR